MDSRRLKSPLLDWLAPALFVLLSAAALYFDRADCSRRRVDWVLVMSVFCFVWFCVSQIVVALARRQLGMTRAGFTDFLAGPRPSGDAELLVWRGTLHVCLATLALVICVILLVFAE